MIWSNIRTFHSITFQKKQNEVQKISQQKKLNKNKEVEKNDEKATAFYETSYFIKKRKTENKMLCHKTTCIFLET